VIRCCLALLLTAPLATAQEPKLHIVFVDLNGEEVSQTLSSPSPVIVIDQVGPADWKALDEEGGARIRIAGTVTDALADIVPGGAADVTEIEIGAALLAEPIRLPVRRVLEPTTPGRPFAFRGRFEGTIVTRSELVTVETKNVIGNTGYASLHLDMDVVYSPAVTQYTGNDFLSKFMDAYTLVLQGAGEAPERVLFYPGHREPLPADIPLSRETAGTYVGSTPELGRARLTIERPAQASSPGERRTLEGTFNSTGLFIDGQQYSFLETRPGTGIYRSPARRLPDNRVLELSFPALPTAGHRDRLNVRVGTWQAFAAESTRRKHGTVPAGLGQPMAPAKASLRETAQSSDSYRGALPGLGNIEVVVRRVEASSDLEVVLSSAALSVRDLLLVLVGQKSMPGLVESAWTFRTQAVGPESLEVRGEAVRARVTGVRQDPPRGKEDEFHPFWVTISGPSPCGDALRLTVDGRPIELAAGKRGGGRPRSALPFVFVEKPPNRALANVLPGLEDGDDHTPRSYEFSASCDR
jgi:hypothetical protein